jgi:signal transduction histidine kinase
MALAEFIRTNIDAIAQEWEEFAKSCTPASIGMTRTTLLNDVIPILEAIAHDMETPQSLDEEIAKGKGRHMSDSLAQVAANHVGARIESRFDLAQIVSEYRAVRASALRLYARSEGLSEETREVVRFSEAIDESVAEIVPTFLHRESQYRDRFFGMLGHDLRGPINAIGLCAALLTDGPDRSADDRRWISRILKSCDRLDHMVKDIIDFTRGRFGEPMRILRVRADLKTVVRDIISEIQCANPAAIINFSAAGPVPGEWDSDRLSQLLWNLVMNAIQHGKAKQVEVKVETENNQVLIAVHNEGQPIPPDALATIFNPLMREGNSDHHPVGLGLGLFICKEIVKAHGGTLVATSTWEVGTTFTVRMNKAAFLTNGVSRHFRVEPCPAKHI